MEPFPLWYARWRLTGFYAFPFFLMWRKWDEKRKCNGLPAFNSYPVASYISKAATSVLFKWPLLFYFVHIRYKLWWMLYRSYSVIWPQSRQVSWETLEAQMICHCHRLASSHSIDFLMIFKWGITSKCTSTHWPTVAIPRVGMLYS